MSDTKICLLSAGFSLACSALLFFVFSSANKSSQIQTLFEQTKKPIYLKTQDQMNREMAEVMLPLLKNQHKEDETRSTLKKPDTIYTPEQLQSSRGY